MSDQIQSVDSDIQVNDAETPDFDQLTGTVQEIPVGAIHAAKIALRGVQQKSEAYARLQSSIKKLGVLQNIIVKAETLPGGVTQYRLIDGLQRFSIAKALGMETLHAKIVDSESEVNTMVLQLVTNLNRVETSAKHQSDHLLRILNQNPDMSVRELAELCCQSETWVEKRLALANLVDKAKNLLAAGEMTVANAYALSRLPAEHQDEEIDNACSEAATSFVSRVRDKNKAIRKAQREGSDTKEAKEWKPTFTARSKKSLVAEYKALFDSEGDSVISKLIQESGVTTIEDATKLFVAWAVSMDEGSVAEQKATYEQRQATAKAKAERRKQERARLKAAEEQERSKDLLNV